MKPYIISITGPSGSGKTALVSKLQQLYSSDILQSIRGDWFYKDQSSLSFEERCTLNYDTPEAFEFNLLNTILEQLSNNKIAYAPTYDFKTHTRANKTIAIKPSPIIIVEGILVLADQEFRNSADCHVFINTPIDVCLLRRIRRDCVERGRDPNSVLNQYEQTVRPMMFKHLMPLQQYAHQSLPDGGWNEVSLQWMCNVIDSNINVSISN